MYKLLNFLGKRNYKFNRFALILPWFIPVYLIHWLLVIIPILINLLQYYLIGFRTTTTLKRITLSAKDYIDIGVETTNQLHEPMHELHRRLYYVIKVLTWVFSCKQYSVPACYYMEITSMVTAYNKIYPNCRISTKEVITMHLLADYGNLFGCTTGIRKQDGILQILRILDWPSYGCLANYVYLIERKLDNYPTTYSISPVWMIGATTIWNESGHFYQMNVAKGEISGTTPSTFTNRLLAEQTKFSTDLYDQSLPYNLIASNGRVVIIRSPYYKRKELTGSDYVFAIANEGMTNHHDSFARKQALTSLLPNTPLFDCATHPLVNKWDTQLVAVFTFGETINVETKLNNIFAAI